MTPSTPSDDAERPPFRSLCAMQRREHLYGVVTGPHESAGELAHSSLDKFYGFALRGEDIYLHVCKHCGCVYAALAAQQPGRKAVGGE